MNHKGDDATGAPVIEIEYNFLDVNFIKLHKEVSFKEPYNKSVLEKVSMVTY